MVHSPQPLVLRGYVCGRARDWRAICLDLDIAATGESMEEARQILDEMIADYLSVISSLPAAEQERMLKRRAPWTVRARYHLSYAYSALFSGATDSDRLTYSRQYDLSSEACTV